MDGTRPEASVREFRCLFLSRSSVHHSAGQVHAMLVRDEVAPLSDNQRCVRTVSDGPVNLAQVSSRTDAHPSVSLCGQAVEGVGVDASRCASLSAAGIYFQACSFNHSDISPFLESTACERSDIRLSHVARDFIAFCKQLSIQRFAGVPEQPVARIVSDLRISLTMDAREMSGFLR